MKKLLITIVMAVSLCQGAVACTSCGCAMYGNFLGIMPQNQRNFFGFSYYHYSINENEAEASSINSYTSTYSRVEGVAGIKLFPWWQISTKIPYTYNTYFIKTDGSVTNSAKHNGIGDIAVVNNFTLYTTADSLMQKYRQVLVLTAGIELPTGSFNANYKTDKEPAALSTGSGSTDFIAGLQYTIQVKTWSLRADYIYKLNTINQSHYAYGNQHTADLFLAKTWVERKITLSPYAGIVLEKTDADYHYTYAEAGTETKAFYASGGIEGNCRKINAGVNVSIPAYNQSEGSNAIFHPHITAYCTYMF